MASQRITHWEKARRYQRMMHWARTVPITVGEFPGGASPECIRHRYTNYESLVQEIEAFPLTVGQRANAYWEIKLRVNALIGARRAEMGANQSTGW